MKIGGFKLGKKDKAAPQEETAAEDNGEQIEAIAQGVEPVRPHAPLQELSLDAENTAAEGTAAGTDAAAVEEPAAVAEEEGEAVKLVEVQPNPTTASAPPPPASPPPPPIPVNKDAAKKNDTMDLNTSIGNIFNDLEDETNPLSNLIKSLPDVAATELIDDLKEINDIIKDWQKK